MALDFPSSPTNGQYYNGFVYNAANQTWDSAYAPRAATVPISSPNVMINGGFDIWQRGTTGTYSSGAYSADRWISGSNSTTISRDTDVPAGVSQYSLKIVASSANSIYQRIESANISAYAGQTVTLSFYYKRTSGTGNVDVRFYYPSATDNFGTTTQIGSTVVLSASPSSSWTRYQTSLTLPSDVTKGLQVLINNDGNTTSYIAGVQLEAGAAVTEFRRNAPSIQAELAACQRYYFRAVAESSFGYFGMANAYAVNNAMAWVQHPVVMRTIASSVEWNGTGANYMLNNGAAGYNLTSFALNAGDSSSRMTAIAVSATGPTAGTFWRLMPNGAPAAYIGINAEL